MTNYEIWSYDWNKELTADERRLYKFASFDRFAEYVIIGAKTHNVASVHYDKVSDTLYVEE